MSHESMVISSMLFGVYEMRSGDPFLYASVVIPFLMLYALPSGKTSITFMVKAGVFCVGGYKDFALIMPIISFPH